MNKYILLPCVVLFICGCASRPTGEEFEKADFGEPMNMEQCRAAVEAQVAYAMKDPSSVQWRHGPPCRKFYAPSVPLMGLPIEYGYLQTGEINAKNSYGAYVGFTRYEAIVRNGRVVRYCLQDRDGLCIPRQ